MNIIVIIKFMRISFEVSSVAATKLPSGWWPLVTIPVRYLLLSRLQGRSVMEKVSPS